MDLNGFYIKNKMMKTDKSNDFIKSGKKLITDQDSDKILSDISKDIHGAVMDAWKPKNNVTKNNARIPTQDS